MPQQQIKGVTGDLGPDGSLTTYTVPGSAIVTPYSVSATFDGTGAAGSFLPCLTFKTITGAVIARCPAPEVAAGDTAEVSWFPHVAPQQAQTGPIAGVIIDQFLVDSKSSTETSGSAVLASGTQYLVTVQGTYSLWNHTLNVGTPNADAIFPSSTSGRISTQVGLDPECCFAFFDEGTGFTLGHKTFFQFDTGTGLAYVTPQGGPYSTPQANYLYRYTLTGTGVPLSAKLVDTAAYSDNYGQMQVVVYSLSGSSSGGGGGGSLVPPAAGAPDGDVLTLSGGLPEWEAATPSGISDLTSTASTITVSSPTGPTTNVDLPNTGVTASSYGDASHVGAFTVDSQGRLTAASSVSITGGGAVAGADGWVTDTNSYTFATANSFTVGASDLTAVYSPGTRIKLTQTTAKYFVVSSASFGSGTTTVNVTAGTDYTLANAAITSPFYSYVDNPQGFPSWFNFNAAATGFSALTQTGARFNVLGRLCTVETFIVGTSNATTFTITLPIAAAQASCYVMVTMNANVAAAGRVDTTAASTTASMRSNAAGAGFTGSGTKASGDSLRWAIGPVYEI